ncbi:unnamed protein product [Porites evermanni]|uniref:Uncharacterized protein n=1 Tax=Porites evermanni TaxID=104178 RepID=A0ABN8RQB7_9CNID|nr:unnamed protein product [Porites evermanni]
MANDSRIVILTGSIFLLFFCRVHSLKCYKCTATSAEQCSASQNVTTCDDKLDGYLECGILTYDDHGFQYLKDCLWPKFCDGKQDNCTINVCNEDYCNGPPPPTTAVKPSAAGPNPSTTPTTTEADETRAPPSPRSNANRSLTWSLYGMLVSVLAIGKMVETCNVS